MVKLSHLPAPFFLLVRCGQPVLDCCSDSNCQTTQDYSDQRGLQFDDMNTITHYPTSILLFHSPYPFCCSRSLHCSLWSTLTLVPLWSGGPEKQIQRPATECKYHITVLKFSSLFLDFLPSLHFNPPTRLPSSEGIGRSLNSESVKSEGCVTPAVHVKQLDYWSTVYNIFQITLTISLLPPSTL